MLVIGRHLGLCFGEAGLQAGDDFGVQGAVRLFGGLLYLGAEGWRHAQLELLVSAAH